ncbi:hypothetical protein ACXM2N_07330 [Corynebacterium sp. ZY180755]
MIEKGSRRSGNYYFRAGQLSDCSAHYRWRTNSGPRNCWQSLWVG